ncbi:Adenylate cyclase [Streptomyces venezuelae]|uniref:CYTH and CHAD domain-containing protein n=1 Tax=Streptomyces gardneri TaxID=66892 RepID=UPI0006BCDC13|nr:CYTH and CHAD domain-containing protein [Streptomyces gardneri]ALO08432.1 Adenylate cyclase [Streptomyces venezuelae]QPK45644.1 CYTH and CHAD domain-containing protein [Streptomyces gardneri]WRK36987.1 CYTH and CHAD domain-containing protein [Streptomyces venezuelae]CUM41210.1 Adenylate cyclase [Streptomyces venezuelae]
MAETKREIERKYEATSGTRVPDLTRVPAVAEVVDRGVMELDAVYYDTPDLRLAADSITLRRRTGGSDEGWHLKFPVASGIRDEIRAPLADTLPGELAGLLRSRVRGGEVVPVVRLRSARDVRHLQAADGTLLAELSVDTVHAERLPGGAAAGWTEIEVELADDADAAEGADEAILDAIEKRLGKAGIRPSSSASKLARALTETAPPQEPPGEVAGSGAVVGGAGRGDGGGAPGTAGHAVLAYVRVQADAIVALDPAVRRDLPDAVHQLRIACRRMRSAFKTYRKVLDRDVTGPVGAELKWLAGELGVARDQEVLTERLRGRIDALPRTLRLGPVRGRLRSWSAARARSGRRRALAALESARYLALLDTLDELLADPPLRGSAARDARAVLARAVLKDHDRLTARVDRALALDPGRDLDVALHEARKAAKRVRYAAEAATPTLGKPARKFARRVKSVQSLLGEHQDGVVAREALRELADQAQTAGESAFTWGLLHGREEAAAAAAEGELPGAWAKASAPGIRAALTR